MTNILLKDENYNETKREDFIVENNHNKGLRIEEAEDRLYALQPYEIVQNNQIVDISSTPEYLAKIAQEKKIGLQKEIDELEKSQLRAIREVALNKGIAFAMGKLQTLDEQISGLRKQITEL